MNLLYIWSKLIKKLRGSAIKDSRIHMSSKIESGSQVISSTFDKHSFCGYDCQIIHCDVGSFCSIASNVVIGGGKHPMEWVSTSPVFYEGRDSVKAKFSVHKREPIKRTRIGHDVWIGEKALIKQGVTIGDGTVIGMGSVVTKNVEPYTIVAGNPARVIRKRFNDEIIKSLLEIKFWEMDDDLLRRHAQYINNPEQYIEKVKE